MSDAERIAALEAAVGQMAAVLHELVCRQSLQRYAAMHGRNWGEDVRDMLILSSRFDRSNDEA